MPPLTFIRYTDPQFASFTIEVPAGWQSRGGLYHPAPGDRRPWIESTSPDGIYIISDPTMPQSLCHCPGNPEGQFVQMAAGGNFLNLKPGADRAAEHYLKFVLSQKIKPEQATAYRPRADLVEQIKTGLRKMGVSLSRAAQVTAVQKQIHFHNNGQPRIATIFSLAYFDGNYAMGMWAFWNSTIYVAISPPELTAIAEQATLHMIGSYQTTPRMMEIYQRDEAIIANNGAAANMAQNNWFNAQQNFHQAQTAFGDASVNNYWRQQQANDAAMKSWQHNQNVNDQISQSRSDAMLDRQRLADDAQGKQYEVAGGSNYYWLNPQTNEVIGTETNTPPDYQKNYTLLRKM